MARNPNITELWPVSILTRKFGKFQKVNPELIRYFSEYRAANPGPPGPMYSSPDNFSADTENAALKELQQFIMDGLFEIASATNGRFWGKKQSINIHITGLWFQVSNGYGFHETHVHGNCSWSGVYYVQSGQSSRKAGETGDNGMPNGITRFYGPHMEYQAGGHGDLGNLYLQSSTWDSFPEDGKLVIFPAHLKHMVFPYNGDDDRIIVSFHAQVLGDSELRYDYSFH